MLSNSLTTSDAFHRKGRWKSGTRISPADTFPRTFRTVKLKACGGFSRGTCRLLGEVSIVGDFLLRTISRFPVD